MPQPTSLNDRDHLAALQRRVEAYTVTLTYSESFALRQLLLRASGLINAYVPKIGRDDCASTLELIAEELTLRLADADGELLYNEQKRAARMAGGLITEQQRRDAPVWAR